MTCASLLESAPAVTRWSTADVPGRQRADYYAEALNSALAPMQLDPHGEPASLSAEMTMADLGLVSVLRQRGSPHRCYREERDLARAVERTYHLVLNVAAEWEVAHGSAVRLAPGDAMLIDSAASASMRTTAPYDIIHVKFAQDWLLQWLPSPAALVGRPIPASSGWGRALTAFACQLSPEFLVASPLPASLIVDHLGALLALSTTPAAGRLDAGSLRGEASLCARIEDLVAQRCTEPALTAERVAASIGISTRTLHRCLGARQKSFGALLIEARASLATRMLESPLFRRVTIAEIGRRAGFADASHFARVLRGRTGKTPAQLRRDERPGPQMPTTGD